MNLKALVFVFALAACAPTVQPSGPFDGAPRLTESGLVARDGRELPLRKWLPEGETRAVVAALHGFNDYSRAFDDAGRAWARRGIAIYAVDQRGFGASPGFGRWAGTETMVDDAAALAAALRASYPDRPLYLLGDSMGGAVVLVALARGRIKEAAGAVLVAPAVWGRAALGPVKSAMLWLSAHTVPWFEATAEGLDVTPSDNTEMLRRLARDPLVIKSTRMDAIWGLVNLMDEAQAAAAYVDVPVLWLYGTRDEVIPLEPTRRAIAAMRKNGKLTTAFYDSGYHMLLRDLAADVPVNDIAAWILDPTAALPSGADTKSLEKP